MLTGDQVSIFQPRFCLLGAGHRGAQRRPFRALPAEEFTQVSDARKLIKIRDMFKK
jgi:hypothetical protein